MQLLIARNPDPDSRLPFLLRLPLGDGLVFRTSVTWPRTSALFCYPVAASEWPVEPDLVEQATLRACVRRGASIDVVLDRPGRTARRSSTPRRAAGTPASGLVLAGRLVASVERKSLEPDVSS